MDRRHKLILFVLLLLFSVPSSYAGKLEIIDVSTSQFNELMRQYPDMMVLDIRTPGEFNAHHIPGAKNIDFSQSDFTARLNLLDRNRPVLLHCRSGNRSSQSLAIFDQLGFKKVYHLAYGIVNGWPERTE